MRKRIEKVKNLTSLREIANLLEEGRLEAVPKEIKLSLEHLSADDVSALVEIIRLKSYGPGHLWKLSHSAGPIVLNSVENLRVVRSLIEAGKFETAQKSISLDHTEDPEIIIQDARIKCFTGQYEAALKTLNHLISRSDLLSSTRGVAYQLSGHCHLELGKFDIALEHLQIAQHLADVVGNRLGRLGACMFLVKTHALLGHNSLCEEHFLMTTESLSKTDESFRWLLGFYRTWSFKLAAQKSSDSFEKLFVALLLAKELNDELYFAKGLIELVYLGRGFKVISKEEENFILSFINEKAKTQGDVHLWLNTLSSDKISDSLPSSLKFYFKLKNEFCGPANRTGLEKILNFLKAKTEPLWILDVDLNVIIDLRHKLQNIYPENSPCLRLLAYLSEKEHPVPLETAFEKAWNLKWNDLIHSNTISVALSRFNYRPSATNIRRKNCTLFVTQQGLVLGKIR